MDFDLPLSLNVDGVDRSIYADFRDVLTIVMACNDGELSKEEKAFVILNNLYVDDIEELGDINEAYKKACRFIDWDKEYEVREDAPKLIDWKKDYNHIMSAVNKSSNVVDVRELPFMHWWTFLGLFQERGECHFSTIVNVRDKLNKGKKLEPHEKEFLRNNREDIMLKDETNEMFETEFLGGDICG